MELLYDKHDLPDSQRLGDERFAWLAYLGAREISECPDDTQGFLFGYDRGAEVYRNLALGRPGLRDRPEEREELTDLSVVLGELGQHGCDIPTPKTWLIAVDDLFPEDLQFPLFVRTPKSSWKRGGAQSRVKNQQQLGEEMELLRRVFGWDTPILARQWIDVAVAGNWMFGDAPQEIRVWIVDQRPVAWSFHYLHVVPAPEGFPPGHDDLRKICGWAEAIGSVFGSRLICADFIRDRRGQWSFLEAGPGAVCGTAHREVFKYVAECVRGTSATLKGDSVGGPLTK